MSRTPQPGASCGLRDAGYWWSIEYATSGPLQHPSVVVIGAPKTGTTALAVQLARHSSVFVPELKEPRFFYRDTNRSGPLAREFNEPWVRDLDDYQALFAKAGSRITVDASTDYLSQPESAERLARHNQAAKVIIGLRHPVARAFSEHVHLLREAAEHLSFVEAIDAAESGRRDQWVPLFRHLDRSRYSAGLRAFTQRFETFVYRHEDLRADPATVSQNVSDFLGLDPPLEPAPEVNTSGAPRSATVNAILRPRSAPLRAARTVARQLLGPARLATIRATVDRRNLTAPPPPSPEVVANLVARLETDIAATEEILGYELPHWRD